MLLHQLPIPEEEDEEDILHEDVERSPWRNQTHSEEICMLLVWRYRTFRKGLSFIGSCSASIFSILCTICCPVFCTVFYAISYSVPAPAAPYSVGYAPKPVAQTRPDCDLCRRNGHSTLECPQFQAISRAAQPAEQNVQEVIFIRGEEVKEKVDQD